MDLLVLLYEEYQFNRFLNFCGEGCLISRTPNKYKTSSGESEVSSSRRVDSRMYVEDYDKYQEFETEKQIKKRKVENEIFYSEGNLFKEHLLLGSKLTFITEKIRLYVKIHLLNDSDIDLKSFREKVSDLILSEGILRKENIEAKFNYGGYVFKKKLN